MAKKRKRANQPEVIPSPKWVRAFLGGKVVADSKNTLLLRAHGQLPVYYFPEADVRMELLEESSRTTPCAYKGTAPHYSVRIGDRAAENIAWRYPFPNSGYESIQNLLAFYQERIDDFYVDGERPEKLNREWS